MKSGLIKFSTIIFSFLFWMSFVQTSLSQDSKNVIVTALTPIIKYSVAEFKNNVNHDLEVYGCKNGLQTLIKNCGPFEVFIVEIKDNDSLKFFSQWDIDERERYKVNYYLRVSENKKFEFTPTPVFELTGLEMIVDNRALKNMIGKKLYEVTIRDDVNSSAIEAAAFDDSAPFIDIIKIDTVTYHIKLKAKEEFLRNLTETEKAKWSKGEELLFPIGIKLYDKNVTEDIQEYQLFLKKKKKPKKTS